LPPSRTQASTRPRRRPFGCAKRRANRSLSLCSWTRFAQVTQWLRPCSTTMTHRPMIAKLTLVFFLVWPPVVKFTTHVPLVSAPPAPVVGDATWYGINSKPSRSRDGKWFNPLGMTCAVDARKWGTEAGAWYQVCRPNHSQYEGCVVVQVTDTGYLEQEKVLVDLARGAFKLLAPLGQGRQKVYVRRIK